MAMNLINSVWGHPIRYRTGKSTSAVTMQQRIGNLNSLPFTSDEITHKSRQDMEWFPGMVFDLAEGQGKEKSEAHHNRERINLVTWATQAYLTSNMHMHDFMSGVRQHTSQGELYRMLEWTPEEKLSWTMEEEDILRLLNTNHGVAGERFVRWLVQNQDVVRKVLPMVHNRLKERFKFTDDEVDYLSEGKDEKKELTTKVKWIAFKQQFLSAAFWQVAHAQPRPIIVSNR